MSVGFLNSEVEVIESLDLTEIQQHLETATNEFLDNLPVGRRLTPETCRGIIARYTAVLEGNFIYWMTGTYLSAKTAAARSTIQENLSEEIRDCHPSMMHRFAAAACALPTDDDATAVYEGLSNVRLFVGRLSSVPLVLMMAFFEGLIQRFMPYLADLAARRGSHETEYTDVHGVCDIAHMEGLLRALELEAAACPPEADRDLYEGVWLLRKLLETIVHGAEQVA
jgi:hypothetical protein